MTEMIYEFPVIDLKFSGPELDVTNIPIYDLGITLVSVQKLIHKGYLTSESRFEKGKKLPKQKRIDLSLQIGEHRKSSDFYGLIPFVSDPANHEAIKSALIFVYQALKLYAEKRIKDFFSGDSNENSRKFVCHIHGDVLSVVNRVGSGGGTESIQIIVPTISPEPITIDEGVRDYVREIANEIILGPMMTIRGPVQKMYTASKIVTIIMNGTEKCGIHMTPEQFNQVRYDQADRPVLVVLGRPRYRLNQERIFDEFEAVSISFEQEGGTDSDIDF
jgi:hypothetical protein